jgi:hypothetical protein
VYRDEPGKRFCKVCRRQRLPALFVCRMRTCKDCLAKAKAQAEEGGRVPVIDGSYRLPVMPWQAGVVETEADRKKQYRVRVKWRTRF